MSFDDAKNTKIQDPLQPFEGMAGYTSALLISCLVALIGGLQFGYGLGATGGLKTVRRTRNGSFRWSHLINGNVM